MSQAQHPGGFENEVPFDLRKFGWYLGFALGAVRRRWVLFAAVAGVTMCMAGAAVVFMPRSYEVSARILTRPSFLLPALVHPRRAIPFQADRPTRGAVELIMSRQNLEALLKDAEMVGKWAEQRGRGGRLKDKIRGLMGKKPGEDDLREAILAQLEENIRAHLEGGVIAMSVTWPHPGMAMDLGTGLLKRFLDTRRGQELKEIEETVTILTRHADAAKERMDEVETRLETMLRAKEAALLAQASAGRGRAGDSGGGASGVSGGEDSKGEKGKGKVKGKGRRKGKRKGKGKSKGKRKGKGRRGSTPGGASDDASGDDAQLAARRAAAKARAEMARVQVKLNEAQQSVRRLQAQYDQRIDRAKAELATLQASLGPDHPDVVFARRSAKALAKVPAELAASRREENRWLSRLQAMQVAQGSMLGGAGAATSSGDVAALQQSMSEDVQRAILADPEIQRVMDEYERRRSGHDDLRDRLANAQMEKETATAAFGFRYVVTAPPQYPKKPSKPNVPLVAVGGLFAALLLGAGAAVISDVMGMRVVASWQVESFVGTRVLGEMELGAGQDTASS